MKHISIRVAWHDNKWNGTICKCPKTNPFCMMLHNISEKRDENKENEDSCKNWNILNEEQLPPCVEENGGFMNEKSYKKIYKHVYSNINTCPHSKLLPTEIELNPYSCFGTPFRYLSNDYQKEIDRKYPNIPEDEIAPFKTSWVHGKDRQYYILDQYKSAIKENSSISIFYCKKGNPIDENSKLIVGIGEITKVLPIQSYNSTADYSYPFWNLIFEHGIRTNLNESKGFLLPYHEYLLLDENVVKRKTGKSKEQVIDEIKITLTQLGNSQKIFEELSYACEYVSNHSMLIILNTARKCIENVIAHKLVGGNWEKQILWIDEQIGKVKSNIGPFPSFAEALSALGVNYSYIIEQDLRNNGFCNIKDNPWIAFSKLINKEISLPDSIYKREFNDYKAIWDNTTKEEKEILELLSRFEINSKTIEYWINNSKFYKELLNNPYIISEESCINDNSLVTTEMIDIGVIPDIDIQGDCAPCPPSAIESKIDKRRIRSLVISKLASNLNEGDTLLSTNEIELHIQNCLQKDNFRLPYHYILTNKEFIEEKVIYINQDNKYALQLKEYFEIDNELRKIFSSRAKKNVKLPLNEDWSSIVKNSILDYNETNAKSQAAFEDQVKALNMFSAKRLSLLAGQAGTGKTTVVKAFLNSEQIKAEGVLLLAPTGKARVRLGNMAPNTEALTIVQFLTRQGFFNWKSMTPFIPKDNLNERKYIGAKNIIIDECSMVTSKEFYVLLKALDLKTINRIILIGDPYQLPPIGPGRPFADLYHYLNENKAKELKEAITELRTIVRTINIGDSDILSLASWFSGAKPTKNADKIFDNIINNKLNNDLSIYIWNDENDLKSCLQNAIINELSESSMPLDKIIRKSIGLNNIDKAFNNPEIIENFQVLSPVINPVWGTYQINSYFQEWIGINKNFSIEISPNNISYLDKVIQLKNEKREYEYNKKEQLSNGQIGYVIYAKKIDKKANVVFSGLPNKKFTYYQSLSDEGEKNLDLAYAITIHKSQGSDFNTVIVVLPSKGAILSRELIYTALTRAKKKLILLIQNNISWLMQYTKPEMSVIAKRNSNLFSSSIREEALKIPYTEGLIHTTLKPGLIVRSKSEVIIANMLFEHNINFEYEKMIEENGKRYIPDFTFEDASGEIIIWEHLGMLDYPSYKEAWEKKLDFYKSIGFVENDNLFITCDHKGSINSTEIAEVISKLEKII